MIVTFEEHYINGGIFDAVCQVLAHETGIRIYGVGIEKVPMSGKPQDLLDHFGLSACKIEQKVKDLLK